MTRPKFTPSEARILSCSLPMVADSVWVRIGAPVARWARPAARRHFSSCRVISFRPVAHLMSPARIPEEPIPSVNPRVKISAISSTERCRKYTGMPVDCYRGRWRR